MFFVKSISIRVARFLIFGGLLAATWSIAILIAISAFAQNQRLESEPLQIITARGAFDFEVEIADQPRSGLSA